MQLLLLISHSVKSDSLQPPGLQHARLPCPSPTPGIYSNSCPLIQWCHPTISSCVVPFSSCLHSFPASGSFLLSRLFTSGGQNIGVSASASVLPMNIQSWFPLGVTGLISLQWLSVKNKMQNSSSYRKGLRSTKGKKKSPTQITFTLSNLAIFRQLNQML